MKKYFAVILAAFMIVSSACSKNTKEPAPVQTTEYTEATVTSSVTETSTSETTETAETTTAETTTEETTVTETTEAPAPVTEAPVIYDPEPEPEPPAASPVDYSSLSAAYGFEFDRDPARTWSEIAGDRGLDPSKPMIALTFDDGPGGHTERLLGILRDNNAKATFFTVGYLIDDRSNVLRAVAADGHEIGGHSWSHTDLTSLSEQALVDEIMFTRQKIYSITGVDTRLVRPPYGSNNSFVRAVGANIGVAFINWNVDTQDWKYRNADTVYNHTISHARHGAVILYHDIHGTTVDAMERIIPQLIADGYQLVTVSELMAYTGREFVPGTVYS